jgi:hypothetical protein
MEQLLRYQWVFHSIKSSMSDEDEISFNDQYLLTVHYSATYTMLVIVINM